MKLKRRVLPLCDDCVIVAYEASMAGESRWVPSKARWRRTVDEGDSETFLCEGHKKLWELWTPGQLTLGAL